MSKINWYTVPYDFNVYIRREDGCEHYAHLSGDHMWADSTCQKRIYEYTVIDWRILPPTMPERDCNPEGTKHDAGKPIFGAIPPLAELEVAKVMEFGARKYSRGNWAKVDNLQERYMDAVLRHLNAVRRGEKLDDESGLSHLAHAACCVLFMLDDEMRGGK